MKTCRGGYFFRSGRSYRLAEDFSGDANIARKTALIALKERLNRRLVVDTSTVLIAISAIAAPVPKTAKSSVRNVITPLWMDTVIIAPL